MAATQTQTKDVSMSPDALASVIANATATAVQGAMRPENANPTPTFWNGFGTKGFPELTRRTFFCGVPVDEKQSMADEITLFNQVTTPGTYGPEGRYGVRISGHGNGAILEVSVQGVNTIEGRMGLPPLVTILQTIVREQSAH